MTCLKNGIGKRLDRCAHPPRTARTGGFGAACGGRGEKTGFNCPRRSGLVYTPTNWESKTEIPAKKPV